MRRIVLIATAVGLTGCVAQATRDAVATAERTCAEDGGLFRAKGEPQVRGGVLSEVIVRGECLKPGDPGYAPPGRVR